MTFNRLLLHQNPILLLFIGLAPQYKAALRHVSYVVIQIRGHLTLTKVIILDKLGLMAKYTP
jgi:hypothetical protein